MAIAAILKAFLQEFPVALIVLSVQISQDDLPRVAFIVLLRWVGDLAHHGHFMNTQKMISGAINSLVEEYIRYITEKGAGLLFISIRFSIYSGKAVCLS